MAAGRRMDKKLKNALAQVLMLVLGRGMAAASHWDEPIAREVARWPQGFTILMAIRPHGPKVGWLKEGDGLKPLGSKLERADLEVGFKGLESAIPVLAGIINSEEGYAQHRMSVKGDLPQAMGFIRCVNRLEAFLFPWPLNALLLKRVPRLGLKGQAVRLYIYLLGVPLGR